MYSAFILHSLGLPLICSGGCSVRGLRIHRVTSQPVSNVELNGRVEKLGAKIEFNQMDFDLSVYK